MNTTSRGLMAAMCSTFLITAVVPPALGQDSGSGSPTPSSQRPLPRWRQSERPRPRPGNPSVLRDGQGVRRYSNRSGNSGTNGNGGTNTNGGGSGGGGTVTQPGAPSAPTGLVASDMGDNLRASLRWTDNSDNETGFEVQRERLSNGSWVEQATFTVASDVVTYEDQPGVGTYRYRVRAVNTVGPSEYTGWSQAVAASTVPSDPTGLTATDAHNRSQVQLAWTDTSSNEAGFEVERQTQSGSTWGSAVTLTASANATSLTDAPGLGTHRYRIRAVNGVGASAYTGYATVTVAEIAPAAPTSLAGASAGDGSRVNLTWTDASNNETGFELTRETQSGSTWGSLVTRTLSANATSYQDTAGIGTFRYRIRATNSAGASAYTSYAQVTVAAPVPSAPTNAAASDNTDGSATVTWTDTSSNETGFEVERNPAFPSARTVSANVTTLVDASGVGTFSYRVRALGSSGNSSWSAWATAVVTNPGAGGGGSGGGGGGTTTTEGFTTFTPSADSRVVYVSSTDGNNANDGLDPSRPVRTIAAGMALLRDQMPDFLLLKRGDVWDEPIGRWVKRGRSATERMVISTYGSAAARPLLRCGSSNGFQRVGGTGSPTSLDNIALMGIAFWANTRNGSEWAEGVSWIGAGRNILVEDCEFRNFHYNLSIEGEGDGVFNFVIRRNVIVDAFSTTAGHSQGIYAYKVNGFTIEENVIDTNGWKRDLTAAPTIFNHNLYCHGYVSNMTFRGNISTWASSHGSSVNMDCLIENNFYAKNAVNIWVRTAPSTVRNNVVMDAKDIDSANPRGMGMEVGPTWPDAPNPPPGPALVEGNIFAHSHSVGAAHAIATNSNQQAQNSTMTIRNNIVYNWNGHPLSINNTNTTRYDQVFVQNNTFVEPTSGRELINFQIPTLDRTRFTFSGNTYSSGAPGAVLFKIDERPQTPSQWMAASGETGVVNATVSFVDPNRTAGTYNASMGGTATLDGFLAQARLQSSRNWRPAYTAAALNDYIRAGFVRQ